MSLSSNDFNKRSRTITCISDFGITPVSREALVIRDLADMGNHLVKHACIALPLLRIVLNCGAQSKNILREGESRHMKQESLIKLEEDSGRK